MNSGKKRGRKKIPLPMEEVISDYMSGMTLVELGEKYGVSYVLINYRLKESSVKKMSAKHRNSFRKRKRTHGNEKSERNLEIKGLREKGQTLQSIGDIFGLSRERVRQITQDIHIARLDLPIAQIIIEFEEGMSIPKLGRKYGCSSKTILRKLRENGVEIHDRRKRILPTSVIISEYLGGLTSAELGKKYGCHYKTILKRLKKNGVEIRSKGRRNKKQIAKSKGESNV